ncbi:hypothetical protein F8568_034890 [Actinomadura sp. LD22]|uniref:Knr4/Smi1-like domain-containing protein n=1 Tax=Actinomadura physcomitrii TaxID=2650748 RepID=A0A6I4MMY4_9ACTN|nr:hypothetical protein [Actinomadura physcomitrii]MWA05464.1 hypothetical protein [Actinomadura physcomitrii]
MEFVEFEQLVGPAEYAPSPVDWNLLESRLGLRLPRDYRQLFQRYPNLQIDKFLGIFAPNSDVDEQLRLIDDAMEPLRELAGVQVALIDDNGEEAMVPRFPFYPEPGGLLDWGATENGDRCLWLTENEDSEKWPIIITDGIQYWRYDGNIISFVGGLLDRAIICPIFPRRFPSSSRIDQFAVEA